MKITPNKFEKNFIKVNKPALQTMFSRWLWEIKCDALKMPSDSEAERNERDRVISLIKFFEAILKTIAIVTMNPQDSSDSGI